YGVIERLAHAPDRAAGDTATARSAGGPGDSNGRPAPPAIDRESLMERVEDDDDLLVELVRMFTDERPRLLADIRHALERGDAAAVSRAAHSLKGALSTLCAQGALPIAQRLEEAGARGDIGPARAAFEELEHEMGLLEPE